MLNTNIRILHYPTFLIFSFLLSKGSGDSFIWQKSRSLTDPNRYFEGVLPCEDDNIIIETDDNPAILYLNDDLKVSSIYFQPNGILYFGSSAIIGDQKGDWQCKKNYAVEDAVIKDDEAPSFFDYRSWHQMDLLGRRIKHPKLHALMVPSSDDIAILQTTKPSKITIGNQVQLGRLIFNHKTFSQDDIFDYLYTREGQNVFRLTNPLYAKNFTMTSRKTPSYQFQWPNPDAFIIKNPNFGLAGPQQSTLQKITFQEICSYIECEDAYHYCDTPIRPKGHCCDICGTMATFSQQNFNYDRAQQALREFEVKQDNNTGFSLIRIKDFGKMPLFQLSVIPDKNENFDADKYRHLLYEVYYVVQEVQETPTQFHSTRVEVGFSQWKASSFFAKFINFLVVIFIASVVGVGILKYEVHKNQRLRSFINRRRLPLQTVWYRGDEDVDLNLPTTQVVDRRLGAEGHVESDTFVNPVFDFEDPEKVPKAENDENKLNFEDSEVKMSSLVDIDTL